ncbi:TPA: TniQ family protein [Acinetobacter baumannii]
MSLKLTHTPLPHPDEFIASYLIRTSFVNGYLSPIQMLHNADVKIYQTTLEVLLTNSDKFNLVLKNLNLTSEISELLVPKTKPAFKDYRWSNNIILHHSLIDIELNKYCPDCLNQTGYWRKEWLLKPITTCTLHQIKLQRNCPQCNNPLIMNRRSLFECPTCKTDLKTASKNYDSNQNKLTEWFLNRIEEQEFINNFTEIWSILCEYFSNFNKALSYDEILDLIYLFFEESVQFENKMLSNIKKNIEYAHPRIQLLPFLRCKGKIISIAYNLLSKLRNYNSLSPKLIYREISKLDVSYILGINFVSLQKRLTAGILYHDQFSKQCKYCFSTAIIEHWLVNDKKSIYSSDIYNKPPTIKDESANYYDAQQIAKIFDVNIETVRKFMKHPESGTTKKYISGHSKYCIAKTIIENFSKKYIFISTLARKIDVPSRNLKDKISSLEIYPVWDSKDYPVFYVREAVESLNKNKINNIVNYQSSAGRKKKGYLKDDTTLSLQEVAKILEISTKKVIQLIHHNWLLIDDSEDSLYRIHKKSLNQFIQKKNDPTFTSIEIVLETLNCTLQELIKNWEMNGFIKIRYLGYWLSIPTLQFNNILSIHKEFCTTTEANKLLGVHKGFITDLVSKGVIKPHYFGNHIYAVKFFKRTDVESLRESSLVKKSKKKKI